MSVLKRFILVLLLVASFQVSWSQQDTLPRFSVRNVGNNRFVIGWVNNYNQVKQISIQRSFDSLNYYKTILSVADPSAVQNGFVDTKAPNDHMFYRLFIMLDSGRYLFTIPRRPILDTANKNAVVNPGVVNGTVINGNGSLSKDSTKITAPVVKKPEYVPSVYVYTNKDGYVFINLPDADQKKYRIRFFAEDDSFLFELKNVREPALTLDKSNFLQAGWFKFELFADEKLMEKNKFFLPRDF